MPWTGKTFKQRHNHGLSTAESKKSAAQANAILRETGDDALAIRVANKQARKRRLGLAKGYGGSDED